MSDDMRALHGSPFRAPDCYVSALAQLLASMLARRAAGAPPAGPEVIAELARQRGDLMWSQGFAAGATYAMELAAHPRVMISPDPTAMSAVAEMLDPIRYQETKPAPVLMSVITPSEYRPDRCPRCLEAVTDARPQHPAVGAVVLDADRVLLQPCRHVIEFVDDRPAMRKASEDAH